MFFAFGQQLVFATISILQDSFTKNAFNPDSFTCAPQDKNLLKAFKWVNNQEEEDTLLITEEDPAEVRRFPAISVTVANERDKPLDLNQFGERLVKNGKVIGKTLRGAFEFDIVVRCSAYSTAQRKLLSDATMAILLIKRERFFKDFGVICQSYRRGAYGSQPDLQGDRDIYWQDITLGCYGEWTFDFIDESLQKLGGFNQIVSLTCKSVSSELNMIWNLENF